MIGYISKLVGTVARDEEGASAVEYAILAAVIGAGIVVSATGLKTGIAGAFTAITTKLAAAVA